jgi:hypothetical protein
MNFKKPPFLAAMLLIAFSVLQVVWADGGHTLFITSAVENASGTVTLPLYTGTSQGQTVYYVLTDSSDGNFAQQYGIILIRRRSWLTRPIPRPSRK